MRLTRLFAFLAVVAVACVANPARGDDEPQPSDLVNVKFADGSALKLRFQQETYDVTTPYGKLTIPRKDIRLIELAPRIADDLAKQIEEATANLGSPQFEIREKAVSDLIAIGAKGYPAMLRAFKELKDPETMARMEEVLEKIRAQLPEEQADPRTWDVIHTPHSRISGKLEMNTVPVESPQFGKVELKLADVRDMHFGGDYEEVDLAKLENAPANLYDKANQIGKTFTWKVTGNSSGTVYGTDTYTLDSSLATAAVHAGIVKHGQTGVLRVKIVESPETFVSSTRNGVTSNPWGRYPAAYKIIKIR